MTAIGVLGTDLILDIRSRRSAPERETAYPASIAGSPSIDTAFFRAQ